MSQFQVSGNSFASYRIGDKRDIAQKKEQTTVAVHVSQGSPEKGEALEAKRDLLTQHMEKGSANTMGAKASTYTNGTEHLSKLEETSKGVIATATTEARGQKAKGITPDTAGKLLASVANAESIGVDLLRNNLTSLQTIPALGLEGITEATPESDVTNLLKKIFATTSLEHLAAVLPEKDLAALKLARAIHADCLFPLNLAAVKGQPIPEIPAAKAEKASTFSSIVQHEMASAAQDAKTALQGFKKPGYETVKNQVLYSVDQRLRFNPKMRIACGAMQGNPTKEIIAALKGLPLSSGEKAKLAREIQTRMLIILPSTKNISRSDKTLGEGNFGKVTVGTFHGQPVVVKALKDPTKIGSEFLVHDSLVAHPNLPRALGVMRTHTDTLVVLEQVDGKTLDKALAGRSTASNPSMALHLMGGAIKGMAAMHQQGIAHMDIKLDNIMYDSGRNEARLIDFGNATPKGAPRPPLFTKTKAFAGSPKRVGDSDALLKSYMAYDVAAMGVALADMVTGSDTRRPLLTADPVTGKVNYDAWRSPIKDAEGNFAPGSNFGKFPQLAPIAEAIELMCAEEEQNRPTMEQLKDIMDGRAVTLATEQEYGIHTQEQLDALKIVFGPEGMIADGSKKCKELLGSPEYTVTGDAHRISEEEPHSDSAPDGYESLT